MTRVKDILNYQATGMVYLPKGAPWLSLLEAECAAFREDGKAKHDDQVDTLADGVLILLGKGTSILQVLGKERRPDRPVTAVGEVVAAISAIAHNTPPNADPGKLMAQLSETLQEQVLPKAEMRAAGYSEKAVNLI